MAHERTTVTYRSLYAENLHAVQGMATHKAFNASRRRGAELHERAEAFCRESIRVMIAWCLSAGVAEPTPAHRDRPRVAQRRAPILIMDEAASNLDAASEREVAAVMARAREGRTTLVTAHRLSTIRAADRIVVLDDGRVAETGTHDELLAVGGTSATLLASQLDRAPTDSRQR